MIVLDQVTVTKTAYGQKRTILSSANLVIPSDRRIALLGLSDEEKMILVDLLSGLILPHAGRIVRKAKISFPVGYLGGFDLSLTVRGNVAHLARLYDADVKSIVGFVERTARLGDSFDKPYGSLARDVRSYLGRIVAYSISFDMYVLENRVVPCEHGREDISNEMFEARSRTSGMIIPMRHMKFAREYCDMGMVLNGGKLQLYDRVEDAIAALQHSQ